MRIAHLSVRHYRGIKSLDWSPSPELNCLIGPGDSCKTTILDAIETALTPRYGFVGSDSDIYAYDPAGHPEIKVTLVELPEEFLSDKKFGLHLRGWSDGERKIFDERREDDLDALTVRASLDPETLEWSWGIFNDRIDEEDPPRFSLKDSRKVAPNRLGAYADRHLTWGRNSALSRLDSGPETSELLTKAVRSARASFKGGDRSSFDDAVNMTATVSKHFLVPHTSGFEAQLDLQSGVLASGAVSLHDGRLPLRTLGSGSSRLMVAGLQQSSRTAAVSMIDEIELGLEPHRIMRLLRFLRSGIPDAPENGRDADDTPKRGQIILTTHSPVVVCELKVNELHCVRSFEGTVTVASVRAKTDNGDVAQRHVRSTPSAFLAPRIIIGEGRTECGFLRGLDERWSISNRQTFASKGVVAVDGGGNNKVSKLAKHLLELGYGCLVLLDSDHPISQHDKEEIEILGGVVKEWSDECDTERRIFLDVPWDTVRELIACAIEEVGESRVVNNMRKVEASDSSFDREALDALEDSPANRDWLAKASTLKIPKPSGAKEDKSWFKNMERGERLGAIVHSSLDKIATKPLAVTIQEIRRWVDG